MRLLGSTLFCLLILLGCATQPQTFPYKKSPLPFPESCQLIPDLPSRELHSGYSISYNRKTNILSFTTPRPELDGTVLSDMSINLADPQVHEQGMGSSGVLSVVALNQTTADFSQKYAYRLLYVKLKIDRYLEQTPTYNSDWKQSLQSLASCLDDSALMQSKDCTTNCEVWTEFSVLSQERVESCSNGTLVKLCPQTLALSKAKVAIKAKNTTDCDTVPSFEAFECKQISEEALMQQAIAANDISLCLSLSDIDSRSRKCQTSIAVNNLDLNICMNPHDEYCISQIALAKGDSMLCKSLSSSTQVLCFKDIAVRKKDASICKEIADPQWQNICTSELG